MDLVEIRKKANSKKKKTAKVPDQSAAESVEPQEQPQPEEAAPVEAPAEESLSDLSGDVTADQTESPENESVSLPGSETDPLDALFSYSVEDGLMVHEANLQSLVGEDDVVDNDIQQWLTFSLANEEYAVTIDSVSEIIKPREVTEIPRVPAFIAGIISLRGIIVPIFDLNQRLNLGSTELGNSSRIIVCQDGERLAGLLVDSINQVVNIPLTAIEPPPTVLSGLDRDFVEGVGRVDNRMLIQLHLANVLNAELI